MCVLFVHLAQIALLGAEVALFESRIAPVEFSMALFAWKVPLCESQGVQSDLIVALFESKVVQFDFEVTLLQTKVELCGLEAAQF